MNSHALHRGERGESPWRVTLRDYAPAAGLVGLMAYAWVTRGSPGGMASWGVSAAALAQGRYETIGLHMFAHGGWLHLLSNSLALLEIGGLVAARLGGFPRGWLLLILAFGLTGMSSMIFFMSFHPQGQVPMIGASGGVYGLLGLLLGMRLVEEVEPVRLNMLPGAILQFARENLFFLLVLLIGGVLAALPGTVAWEAHLGGFLCGFCLGPWLLPPSIRRGKASVKK